MADNRGSFLRNAVAGLVAAIGSALASVAIFSKAVEGGQPEEQRGPGQQRAASGQSSPQPQPEVPPVVRQQASERQGAGGGEKQAAETGPTPDEVDGEMYSPYSRPIITEGDHVSYPLEPTRPGWSIPEPKTIPRPTYWPVVMALGITFLAWGFVTSIIVTIFGIILFAISLAGWIGEIQHEQHEHGHEER